MAPFCRASGIFSLALVPFLGRLARPDERGPDGGTELAPLAVGVGAVRGVGRARKLLAGVGVVIAIVLVMVLVLLRYILQHYA